MVCAVLKAPSVSQLLLLLAVLLCVFPGIARAQCPAGCTCTGRLVRCRSLNDFPPPDGFPPRTTYLDLSYCDLEELPAHSFTGLSELVLLNLQDNRISTISPQAFTDLSRLERLNLRRNLLEVIRSHTFQHLVSLQTLYLSGNRISELQDHAFSGLARLDTLVLDNNDLHTVTKLNVKPLISLKTLEMRAAGLHCDCQVAWMKVFQPIDVASLRCLTPPTLAGRGLAGVSFSELNCTLPSVEAARDLVQGYHGDSVLVECYVEGDPLPETVVWSYNDGGQIADSEHYRLLGNGSLLVRGVVLELAGVYTCLAENLMGVASDTVTLQYAGSRVPGFLERPVDTHAFEGETVRLLCSVDQTIQQQHWSRDGQTLLPSNRVTLLGNGGLEVADAMSSDSGVYSCVASNGETEFTASAVVTVTGPLLSCSGVLRREDVADVRSRVELAFRLTQQELHNLTSSLSPSSLLRRLNFPQNGSIDLFKAAEIYAELVAMVRSRQDNHQGITPIPELSDCEATVLAELSGCRDYEQIIECPAHSCVAGAREYRSFDGTCNSLNQPLQGSAARPLKRLLPPRYEDGLGTPVGWSGVGQQLPSARLISSKLMSVAEPATDDSRTHMLMQFGQFLDHDIDHTPVAPSDIAFNADSLMSCDQLCSNLAPCFPIPVAPDDPRISLPCLPFTRSSAVCGSGAHSVLLAGKSPVTRQQINAITSFIDLSQIYGSSDAMATQLRDPVDPAYLLTGQVTPSGKPLLPLDHNSLIECSSGVHSDRSLCFLSGDARTNEQVGLTVMHTLFFREHNRLATALSVLNPHWHGEKLFQETRRLNIAQWQHMVYQEYLPAILGSQLFEEAGFSRFPGYDAGQDATISNVFATAAYRFGHAQIMPLLHRLDHGYQEHPAGPLMLQDAFFAPFRILEEGGVDPLIRGLIARPLKLRSPHTGINNNLTEALFQQANEVALDLAALNIQRGRDHGLPSYNQWREFCGGQSAATIEGLHNEITNGTLRLRLREVYGDAASAVDLWVGGLLEAVNGGGQLGPTFGCLISEQFQRLRTGDRFWYEREGQFTADQRSQLKQASLSRIICDNADNITRVPRHAFRLEPHSHFLSCDLLPRVNLQPWLDCSEEPEGAGRVQRSVLMDSVYEQMEQRLTELESKAERCRFNTREYRSGERWQLEKCHSCSCEAGEVICLKTC